MTNIACSIKQLTLPFGDCLVSLNFTLPVAGCTLMGRNGIGKSLLLELLAGQRHPVEGAIEWFTSLGLLSQLAPPEACSVADFIGWGEQLRALERIEKGSIEVRDFDLLAERWGVRGDLVALLSEAGLAVDTHPSVDTLSGGQLTRLRLLALFIHSDSFLLLDEPDNHLDHASRQLLTQVLADYPGTLLLVSHDPDFVAGVGINREYMLGEKSG